MRIKSFKIRVKTQPKPSSAMETVDDYVDLATPAVGANGVDGVSIPMPLGHHHGHVSDPSMVR